MHFQSSLGCHLAHWSSSCKLPKRSEKVNEFLKVPVFYSGEQLKLEESGWINDFLPSCELAKRLQSIQDFPILRTRVGRSNLKLVSQASPAKSSVNCNHLGMAEIKNFWEVWWTAWMNCRDFIQDIISFTKRKETFLLY